ncbi:uncharacterized protein LOC127835340 [Dreissena polymorpha]|uniref:Uncharacterized protein n=1 Tax=Dreissena polymorpha TaxID=45954 RepID=A0A9D4FVM7_DREPO|nr:uncharacterized protein LOC127835340 [Dreissena polymorpha]KAH3806154.1 hypothetical protein DPMN_134469 [Dreissena polymorpha]
MAQCSIAISSFPLDTFPRYQYTMDRVETLLAKFKRLGFETSGLPKSDDISILELKSNGSASHFLISDWIVVEKEILMTDRTTFKQYSTSEAVVVIVYDKALIPDKCVYGIILETGQQTNFDTKENNIICSSIEDLKTNTDRLLERYLLSFLKKAAENVSPCTIEEAAVIGDQNPNDVKRTVSVTDFGEELVSKKRLRCSNGEFESRTHACERTLSDVMAIFKRSCAPPDEWPNLEKKEIFVLNDNVSQELSRLDPSLIGVGYEHDILQMFVDRNENVELDTALENILAKHKIAKHHINHGPWKCVPLCDIRVGQHIRATTQRIGTVGGFATRDGHLYALTARHVVEGAEFLYIDQSQGHVDEPSLQDSILYSRSSEDQPALGERTTIITADQRSSVRDDNTEPAINVDVRVGNEGLHTRLAKFAIVERGVGELDIAAARIERPDQIRNPMFMSSRKAFKKSILFDFRRKDEHEIRKLLDSEQVYAWASSKVPLKGQIYIPIYKNPITKQRFVAIKNEFDVPGSQTDDLPDPNAFGKEGDSGAIVCSDDIDGKGVIVYSMFTNKLENENGRTFYLTLILQDGLDQLANNIVPETTSHFVLC